MDTPVWDFVRRYAASGTSRMHMPGHKGQAFLGCEALDITEIAGADSLYEASGILEKSEKNASDLFGSKRTLYSTEGSSQCIRAMLYLALTCRPTGASSTIVAARNVHKAFVFAAALLGFDIAWLWPEGGPDSLCACAVSPETLSRTLDELGSPPAAVYLTSPDYLGGCADIAALARVCHEHNTLLIVDNAHGAYLHFLSRSQHPLDLGADICCDSAHKTLPVLTGGAYLHIARRAPAVLSDSVRAAMALFGSTSPSYLTLCSLDRCNAYLAAEYPSRLSKTISRIEQTKQQIIAAGWNVMPSDPLRITLRASDCGMTGSQLAKQLRRGGIECEYADPDDLVLMLTPENAPGDYAQLVSTLGAAPAHLSRRTPAECVKRLPSARNLSSIQRAMPVREALLSPHESIPTRAALGRVCGAPTVSCPPAIPIVVSGEVIDKEAIALFERYGVEKVEVLKERE